MPGFRKQRTAPAALREWRRENPGDPPWNALDHDVKQTVRERLHRDQRGMCCYCYACIEASDRERMEHIVPQGGTPDVRFDWENLAIACDGGERAGGDRHCDVSKGETRLTWIHPYRQPVTRAARMRFSGTLDVQVADARTDIEDTLNLNCADLCAARRGALRGWLVALPRQGAWRARDLDAALRELDAGAGCQDFAPWIRRWLERQLHRAR